MALRRVEAKGLEREVAMELELESSEMVPGLAGLDLALGALKAMGQDLEEVVGVEMVRGVDLAPKVLEVTGLDPELVEAMGLDQGGLEPKVLEVTGLDPELVEAMDLEQEVLEARGLEPEVLEARGLEPEMEAMDLELEVVEKPVETIAMGLEAMVLQQEPMLILEEPLVQALIQLPALVLPQVRLPRPLQAQENQDLWVPQPLARLTPFWGHNLWKHLAHQQTVQQQVALRKASCPQFPQPLQVQPQVSQLRLGRHHLALACPLLQVLEPPLEQQLNHQELHHLQEH